MGLFDAAASLVTTPITNRAALKRTRETNRMQKQLADEAWARETAYNSPSAQMQRYRDAGLNPHLIYSQQDSGYQYQTPDVETPEVYPYQFSNLGIGDFQDIRTKKLSNGLLSEELKRSLIDTQFKLENSDLDLDIKKLMRRKTASEILGIDYANQLAENDIKRIPVKNLIQDLESQKLQQDIKNSVKSLDLQEKHLNNEAFVQNVIRSLIKRLTGANSTSASDLANSVVDIISENLPEPLPRETLLRVSRSIVDAIMPYVSPVHRFIRRRDNHSGTW